MHGSTQRHTRSLGVSKGNRDTSEERSNRGWMCGEQERRAGNEKFRNNKATNGITGWKGSKYL